MCVIEGSCETFRTLYFMKRRATEELWSESIASSGHSISHVRQSRQFRPQTGCPASLSVIFPTGQRAIHRPHALHFFTSALNNLQWTQVDSQRLNVSRSKR